MTASTLIPSNNLNQTTKSKVDFGNQVLMTNMSL